MQATIRYACTYLRSKNKTRINFAFKREMITIIMSGLAYTEDTNYRVCNIFFNTSRSILTLARGANYTCKVLLHTDECYKTRIDSGPATFTRS